ncbi:MAG: DUF6089 family protein [Bacteroidota bacterium]
MRVFYCLLSMLLLCTSGLLAQEDKWDGGFFLGGANYTGDVIEGDGLDLSQTNLAFGFMLKRNLNNVVGVRLGLTTGQLTSSEVNSENFDRMTRGFSFENRLTELGFHFLYEPLGEKRYRGGNFRQILSPYVFVGPNLIFSNPDTDYNIGDQGGRRLARIEKDQEASDETAVSFVFGGGLRYDISRKWTVGLEIGIRRALTDLIDGVSASANPDRNDWYAFSGLTLTTRFGAKDSDNDGIADDVDKCPQTPGISATSGCPDADLDGIADNRDGCPDVAGDPKFNGCPDTDDDGVADNQDNCPNTPGKRRFRGCPDTDEDGIADPVDICPTIAGVEELDGCPDADRDGVTDADDACPQLPGVKEANGCPDADLDGVIDPNDKCVEIPGDAKFDGCPDGDNDGIGDGDDACPSNPGPIENDGCPVVAEEDIETLELAMRNVRFRTGSERLLTISHSVLDEVAEIMDRYPNYNLKMSGFSDNRGNDAANQALSEKRALSCYQYLLVKGISRDRMSYAGYGETNPIDSNDTPTGRARNRRVEFELVIAQ